MAKAIAVPKHADGGGGGEWTDIGDPVVAIAAASVEFTGLDNTYKEYRIKSFDLRISSSEYLRAYFQTGDGWIEGLDYESQSIHTTGSNVVYGSNTKDNGMRLSTYNTAEDDIGKATVDIRIFNHADSEAQTVLRTKITWYSTSYTSPVFGESACSWDIVKLDNVTGVRLFGLNKTISGTFQLQGRN